MQNSPGLPARHGQPGRRVDDLDLEVRVHPADGGGAPVEVVVGAGLGGHRRGLGHAVADGHLGHAHLADHPLHHLHRARRAGHDPGAQAWRGRSRRSSAAPSSAMNIVGTPYSDVHRSSCTACSVSAGSKPGRRDDHRRAVRGGRRGCPCPCRSSGSRAPGCRSGRPRCSRSPRPRRTRC